VLPVHMQRLVIQASSWLGHVAGRGPRHVADPLPHALQLFRHACSACWLPSRLQLVDIDTPHNLGLQALRPHASTPPEVADRPGIADRKERSLTQRRGLLPGTGLGRPGQWPSMPLQRIALSAAPSLCREDVALSIMHG
jgi:hypothetical protein